MLLGGWGTEFDDVMRWEGGGAEVPGGRSHVSSVVVWWPKLSRRSGCEQERRASLVEGSRR